MNKIKAVVFSADTLGDVSEKEIRKSLIGLFGKNTEVSYMIDENLVAGLLVKIGSRHIDLSLKSLLENI